MPTVTLSELGAFLAANYTRDVLRVETRQQYCSESEQESLRRYLAGESAPAGAGDSPWIRQLRAHATAGRTWRVLHAVTYPLSDYVRYEAEWGYVHNAAAGQDIRVDTMTGKYADLGDLLIIDGRDVFRYTYDEAGRFVSAEHISAEDEVADVLAVVEPLWEQAEPFAEWWARHPQYHRNALAAS